MSEEVRINLIVDRIAPDRSQYKQYGLSFIPHKTLLSVPVDSDKVTFIYQKSEEGEDTNTVDYVVLSLDGLMQVTGRIADSIDDLHNSYLEKLRKGMK